MCSDCRFAGAVTPGYKIRSAGEAVSTGHKTGGVNFVPGRDKTSSVNFVPGRDKTSSVNFVPGRDKTNGVNFVPTGDKTNGVNFVPGRDKTSSVNFVPGRDKTSSVNFVPGRDKTASVGDDGNPVSTGYKTAAADSVSGGYKTDVAAMTASAKCMDACAGAAWMLFAVTARDGMAWTVAGRGAFAVTGCFLLLPFGMRCAGYGYVVMNSFFACRDDFIFSQFVISFLPLKEPLRVRGDFSLLEVL